MICTIMKNLKSITRVGVLQLSILIGYALNMPPIPSIPGLHTFQCVYLLANI